jgi:hypothetical protein
MAFLVDFTADFEAEADGAGAAGFSFAGGAGFGAGFAAGFAVLGGAGAAFNSGFGAVADSGFSGLTGAAGSLLADGVSPSRDWPTVSRAFVNMSRKMANS